MSSAQGYLLRKYLHKWRELEKRTAKHTKARLSYPVIRFRVGTTWACRGVEGGNDMSSLFDQQPYFLIPHTPPS